MSCAHLRVGAAVLIACLASVGPLGAQRRIPAGAVAPSGASPTARATAAATIAPAVVAAPDSSRSRARWWTPLASLVLPGAGQLATGQTRAAAYGALDVYAWLQYREAQRDQRRARNEYQRIARDVARQPCAAPCPAGDQAYYEILEKSQWIGSGRLDAVPGGAIDPETRDSTYNGSVWTLARDLYFPRGVESLPTTDPAYQRALAYYAQRAYGPQFEWSWRDGQIMRGAYRQAIARRNGANRSATNALSVVMANRVFSVVDAYVTLRVERAGPDTPAEFSATIPWSRVPGLKRRPR